MYENAQKIFDYLPIELGTDNLYIQHLWGAFETIIEKEEPVRAFSILPFHLLFMFALQYKIYRISAYHNSKYLEILKSCNIRDDGQKIVLENNAPIIGNHSCSVRNLSLIPEGQLLNFFVIINIDDNLIKKAKELIKIRGTYAHANGNIEEDIESRIDEYLGIMKDIQSHMSETNNSQVWTSNLEDEETSVDEFMNELFTNSHFSSMDFEDIIENLLKIDINIERWNQVVNKGLELAYNKTILELQYLEVTSKDEEKIDRITDILHEHGEESSVLTLEEAKELDLI